MKSILIFVLTIIIWPLDAFEDEKFGSSFEAWQACDEYAEQFMENNGVYIDCDEDASTNKILAFDERTLKVLKRFKYDPLVYGWVGKFGSRYEALQACEEFADKSTYQKNEEIGCEEDTPTNQILALDEDTEKVIKVFKY